MAGVVGVVSGLKGVGEVVGYMVDSRNAAAVVLDHGTVGWDPAEDTSIPFRLPYLGPAPYPCPFVRGGSRVRGSPCVVEGEAVAGTLVG